MLTVRPYVTFEDTRTPAQASRIAAGWPARPSREVDPDDYDPDIWDAEPPGRELAEDLARGLQAGGLPLAFPVSQWETDGWEFTIETGGRKVWFMLQASDEWLLITDTPRRFREKLRGATFEEQHEKALAILASFLAPPRFTNVRWFTKDEFKQKRAGCGNTDMSVWGDWKAKRRARRARLEQNRAFLRRVADEIGAEFETKGYEELRDHGAEEFSSERIVDGITITYSGEAYKTLKNGDLTFCVDVDGLPTPWGIKPSYHFYKRPDGSVYY